MSRGIFAPSARTMIVLAAAALAVGAAGCSS